MYEAIAAKINNFWKLWATILLTLILKIMLSGSAVRALTHGQTNRPKRFYKLYH